MDSVNKNRLVAARWGRGKWGIVFLMGISVWLQDESFGDRCTIKYINIILTLLNCTLKKCLKMVILMKLFTFLIEWIRTLKNFIEKLL